MERAEKARSTQDAILDAAIELFIEAGFDTTPMDAIAERAGVAKGTLYYHFKSKEGIVDAIVERFVRGAEAAFEPVVEDPSLAPFAKLEALTAKHTEINIASFSRLHRMQHIDIHLRTEKAAVSRFAPFYARVLEEGNAAGAWRTEHPLEFAQISIAACSFLFDPECSGLAGERLKDTLVDLMARGLQTDPAALAVAFSSYMEYVHQAKNALPGSAAR